jgi:hypothetical protein
MKRERRMEEIKRINEKRRTRKEGRGEKQVEELTLHSAFLSSVCSVG